MDAVARITGSEQTALTGVCSGGIIAAMVAAHLAHTGRPDQIAALTLLDQARAAWAAPSSTSGTGGGRPELAPRHDDRWRADLRRVTR